MLDFALSASVTTTLLLSGDAGYGAKLAIIIAVVLAVCLLCMLSSSQLA
ncbi:outer membrane murein-binding lipoprotein Lpp [Bradyrhizobium sp. USDA 4354]